MSQALEARLSEIIGVGKNRAIQFGFDTAGGKEIPLLEILLKDGRLVEMPLARIGNEQYGRKEGDEKVILDNSSGIVRVIDGSGKTVTEQKYERAAYTQPRPQ